MTVGEAIDKGIALLKVLTWKRVAMASAFAGAGLLFLTLYENRQKVYERLEPQFYAEDYALQPPGKLGEEVLRNFIAAHPEVALITLIDADPVRNIRTPVHRIFNNTQLEQVIKGAEQSGRSGAGPLFSADAENNKQMIAVMNGEFYCAPVSEGAFANLFPEVSKIVKYSCRIPLPPAFGKATGWFSMHLTDWPPPRGLDNLKFDSLNMSLTYYNAEIAQRGKANAL